MTASGEGSSGRPPEVASPAIDVLGWLADNRELIDRGAAGPVIGGGELNVLLVEGRGPRRDYHVNSVAELFYQLRGDIVVSVRQPGRVRDILVRTGELWIAPAGVPHSPQRPVGSLGMVVERAREPGTTEAFRWFCAACDAVVFEVTGGHVQPAELRIGVAAFNASVAARTCAACGTVVPGPGD